MNAIKLTTGIKPLKILEPRFARTIRTFPPLPGRLPKSDVSDGGRDGKDTVEPMVTESAATPACLRSDSA